MTEERLELPQGTLDLLILKALALGPMHGWGIGISQDWPSPGQYHDIVTQNHVFEDTALAVGGNYTLTKRSTAMKVDGIQATSSLLPMLGAKPMLGRIFLPEEDQLGRPETVVLTYGFWQREFARALRVDLTANLKVGGKGSLSGGLSIRRDKVRGALVIAELAISLPLLVGAGLLVRSFVRLANVPPGFNPQHVVSMNVGAYGPKFKDSTSRVQFYQQLAERISHLPGVTATGAVSALPLTSAIGWGGMHIEGYVPPPNEPELQVDQRASTPPYFSTMQIPLIRGRMFAETDADKMPPIAIIDQKMAIVSGHMAMQSASASAEVRIRRG